MTLLTKKGMRMDTLSPTRLPAGGLALCAAGLLLLAGACLAQPGIDIEKDTNGLDADAPPGPILSPGDPVFWTYHVTNTGDEPLDNVVVIDDQGVAVSCPQDTLAPGESMACTASGFAQPGQYANLGIASAESESGQVEDIDPSHYLSESTAAIDIEKATNGVDADTPPGPSIAPGDPVSWTYVVTNTGEDEALNDVIVVDDQGVAVSCPQTSLLPGESMICTASGFAQVGQYANIGTVTATSEFGPQVEDSDPSHYLSESTAAIDIEKATNGFDADEPPGPSLFDGFEVQWTYEVSNTGGENLVNVAVVDDQGVIVNCPEDTLLVGESMICTGSGTVQVGQYANIGTATANSEFGPQVEDSDPSHYWSAAPIPTLNRWALVVLLLVVIGGAGLLRKHRNA